MSKSLPRKCIHCRTRAVIAAVVPSYALGGEHDGRPYTVTVPNLEVLQCENCQAIVLEDAANDRIDEAMRAAAGLLATSEIRRQQEALSLNQQQLADFLKISMYTLSRWESGTQIQQRAMDAFLRVFFRSSEARSLLGFPAPEQAQVVDRAGNVSSMSEVVQTAPAV